MLAVEGEGGVGLGGRLMSRLFLEEGRAEGQREIFFGVADHAFSAWKNCQAGRRENVARKETW